jgi:hypothetical protein
MVEIGRRPVAGLSSCPLAHVEYIWSGQGPLRKGRRKKTPNIAAILENKWSGFLMVVGGGFFQFYDTLYFKGTVQRDFNSVFDL